MNIFICINILANYARNQIIFLTILQFTLDRPFLDTNLVRPLPFVDVIWRYSPLFAAIIAAIIAALFADIIAAICCYHRHYLPLSLWLFAAIVAAFAVKYSPLMAAILPYSPLITAIRRYHGLI